jgi:hypothetical protein
MAPGSLLRPGLKTSHATALWRPVNDLPHQMDVDIMGHQFWHITHCIEAVFGALFTIEALR